MRLDIPYFEQIGKTNCGANSLNMVLTYFGKKYNISEVEELCEIKSGKGLNSSSITLAVKKVGLNCDFYSTAMGINPENYDMDFYKKYSEEIDNIINNCNRAKELGVNQFQKSINIEDIIELINEKSVLIVLLDWSVIDKKLKGYNGHFVPIVGYDDKYIYVHTGHENNKYFPIEIKIFDKARKSKGTDEDLIIIYNKN